jgi:hypothetical protein
MKILILIPESISRGTRNNRNDSQVDGSLQILAALGANQYCKTSDRAFLFSCYLFPINSQRFPNNYFPLFWEKFNYALQA